MMLADLGAPIRGLSHSAPWLTTPVVVMTAASLVVLGLGVVVLWVRPAGLRAIVAACAATVMVKVAGRLIAHLWFRERPFAALHFTPLFPHAADASFPSTLVAYSAVATTVVALAWWRLGRFLVIGNAIVAFGCVYVGVHWVADVLAGEVLGVACALAAWFLLDLPVLARAVDRIDRYLHRIGLRRTGPMPA